MAIFERPDRPDQGSPETPGAAAPEPTESETRTAAPSLLAPAIPASWGEFRIVRELGHGGFGRVDRAIDEGLAKQVALKIVRPFDPSRIASVLREGQMLARVRHPNVVTVHAVRQVGEEIGFVMELIDGESLADRVHRTGRMGAEEVVAIAQTLCHALAAVHGAGLLHRDIKARNVMRDSGGRIMLMDLGAGRDLAAIEPANDLTGTPLYLAPELFAGRPASRASDIYSLGVLLYFLVTRTFPVDGDSIDAIARAHLSGSRSLLIDRRPDLPHDFTRVIERALAPDPARRYQSAGELLDDLHALSVPRGGEIGSPRPVPLLPSPWAPRIARWAGIVFVTFAVITLFGFLATRTYDTSFSLGRFADDSLGTWIKIGIRAIIPPVAWVMMVLIGWVILRTLWQITRSAMPPVQRLASRVHSSVSLALGRRTPRDCNVLARWLLIGQVGIAIALFLRYQSLLVALVTPFEHSDPAVWQVLFYSAAQLGPVNSYQALLPIAAATMALAWRQLIASAGGILALDRPVVGAGFGIIFLLIAAVAVPFRTFYEAQSLSRYEVKGDRCYEVGRRDGEVRLFCPDIVPAADRSRNRNLRDDDPSLGRPLPRLSPYTPKR